MEPNRENMLSNRWWFTRGKLLENHATKNFTPGPENQLKIKALRYSMPPKTE